MGHTIETDPDMSKAVSLLGANASKYRPTKSGRLTHNQRLNLPERGSAGDESRGRAMDIRAARFITSRQRFENDRAAAFQELKKENKDAKLEDVKLDLPTDFFDPEERGRKIQTLESSAKARYETMEEAAQRAEE